MGVDAVATHAPSDVRQPRLDTLAAALTDSCRLDRGGSSYINLKVDLRLLTFCLI